MGGATTRYILDVNRQLTNVLVETDGAGSPVAYYVYGLGLVARILPEGTAQYYHHDFRGSTIALSDLSETLTDVYAYDPFGTVTRRSGTTSNPFAYIGRQGVLSDGNGVAYVRARYYVPSLGRFLTKDPKAGGHPGSQGLHRFVYAVNNPVRLIDASGYSPREGAASSANTESSDYVHGQLIDDLASLLQKPVGELAKALLRSDARYVLQQCSQANVCTSIGRYVNASNSLKYLDLLDVLSLLGNTVDEVGLRNITDAWRSALSGKAAQGLSFDEKLAAIEEFSSNTVAISATTVLDITLIRPGVRLLSGGQADPKLTGEEVLQQAQSFVQDPVGWGGNTLHWLGDQIYGTFQVLPAS